MKETVSQFDLSAAFKALDEIEYPAATSYKQDVLKEEINFKRVDRTGLLIEDYYNVNDKADLERAQADRELEINAAKYSRIEKIVDLDAKTPEDLKPSYVDKIIIQCPQCMTKFYKDRKDLVVDEADPEVVNVGEACQHCGNDSGYDIIGKVAPADMEDQQDKPADTAVDSETADNEGNETGEADLDLNLDFAIPEADSGEDMVDEEEVEEPVEQSEEAEDEQEPEATGEEQESEEAAEEDNKDVAGEEQEDEDNEKKKEESLSLHEEVGDDLTENESDTQEATDTTVGETPDRWAEIDLNKYKEYLQTSIEEFYDKLNKAKDSGSKANAQAIINAYETELKDVNGKLSEQLREAAAKKANKPVKSDNFNEIMLDLQGGRRIKNKNGKSTLSDGFYAATDIGVDPRKDLIKVFAATPEELDQAKKIAANYNRETVGPYIDKLAPYSAKSYRLDIQLIPEEDYCDDLMEESFNRKMSEDLDGELVKAFDYAREDELKNGAVTDKEIDDYFNGNYDYQKAVKEDDFEFDDVDTEQLDEQVTKSLKERFNDIKCFKTNDIYADDCNSFVIKGIVCFDNTCPEKQLELCMTRCPEPNKFMGYTRDKDWDMDCELAGQICDRNFITESFKLH